MLNITHKKFSLKMNQKQNSYEKFKLIFFMTEEVRDLPKKINFIQCRLIHETITRNVVMFYESFGGTSER